MLQLLLNHLQSKAFYYIHTQVSNSEKFCSSYYIQPKFIEIEQPTSMLHSKNAKQSECANSIIIPDTDSDQQYSEDISKSLL